jgi:hypothetical protein
MQSGDAEEKHDLQKDMSLVLAEYMDRLLKALCGRAHYCADGG